MVRSPLVGLLFRLENVKSMTNSKESSSTKHSVCTKQNKRVTSRGKNHYGLVFSSAARCLQLPLLPNRTRGHIIRLVLMQELYSNFAFSQFCSVVAELFIKATPLWSYGSKKCACKRKKQNQNNNKNTQANRSLAYKILTFKTNCPILNIYQQKQKAIWILEKYQNCYLIIHSLESYFNHHITRWVHSRDF